MESVKYKDKESNISWTDTYFLLQIETILSMYSTENACAMELSDNKEVPKYLGPEHSPCKPHHKRWDTEQPTGSFTLCKRKWQHIEKKENARAEHIVSNNKEEYCGRI